MKWSDADGKFVRDNLETMTCVQIAEKLGRTPDAVRNWLKKNGIRKQNPRDRTKEEMRRITALVKDKGAAAAAKHLGLTEDQVRNVARRFNAAERKYAKSFSTEKAEKFRLRAIAHACANGLSFAAEDFASYCVIRMLEHRTSPMRYMLVDFKRSTFGDIRTENGRISASTAFNPTTVSPGGDEEFKHLTIDPEDRLSEAGKRLFELVDALDLPRDQRAVFLLHNYFGLRQSEIGLVFGYTEGRACQILAMIQKKIS